MAVFEADLVHKQAEEVFRAIITLFLHSPLLSLTLHPSLYFSYSARLGPCLPDNCKQLGKLVAPPSPSRGLLVYNLIEANVKTVKAWEKQDVSVRWNLNCQPVQNIKRVCLIGRQEHKKREDKEGKRWRTSKKKKNSAFFHICIKMQLGSSQFPFSHTHSHTSMYLYLLFSFFLRALWAPELVLLQLSQMSKSTRKFNVYQDLSTPVISKQEWPDVQVKGTKLWKASVKVPSAQLTFPA